MQKITTIQELHNAIQLLELEQKLNKQLLKDEVHVVYNRLNPINMLATSFNNLVTSSQTSSTDIILTEITGLISGFLTRKIIIGKSDSKFRRILATVIQLTVTNLVSRSPEAVKSIARLVYQHFQSNNEDNTNVND